MRELPPKKIYDQLPFIRLTTRTSPAIAINTGINATIVAVNPVRFAVVITLAVIGIATPINRIRPIITAKII